MRSFCTRLIFGLGFGFVSILCGSSALAQEPRPHARIVFDARTPLAKCICKVVQRSGANGRRCDGSTILEQISAHSNGQQLVCSSLSLLDVELRDGACNSSSSSTQQACTNQKPAPCIMRFKFLFAVHSTACHEHAPNGFWIANASQPALRVFRSVGQEAPLNLALKPNCGSCDDAAFSVSMPDGANGMPGTTLYRYMVAADCLNCMTTAQTH